MSDNSKLWGKVEKTPPEHTKPITGKLYQGTSPKPYYLVQKATEVFGPCGIGWGFTILSERVETGEADKKVHIAHVKVWYKWEGEKGEVEHIGGTEFSGKRNSGNAFIDEDAPKKSVTDALVKALSMIGFAGDIFMGRYDDSKYVSGLKEEKKKSSQETQTSNQNKVDYSIRANSEDEFVKGFELRLEQMPTAQDVNQLCKVHVQALNTLKADNPDRHALLKDMTDFKRNQLAQKS